jgi:hypothetical protein
LFSAHVGLSAEVALCPLPKPHLMEIVMKSVIKTAEMLVQFDEQEDAQLVSATLALDEGEDTILEAIATIAQVLGTKPSWARYEMARIRIFETLEQAGKTEDVIKKKWGSIRRELGITIPESDDPEAKRKAEQRAKARAVFAEKSNEDLQAEMAQLLANPTIAKLESAKKISKEIATRQKELGKNAKSELVELRKQVKAEIDSIEDMELLADLLAQLRS